MTSKDKPGAPVEFDAAPPVEPDAASLPPAPAPAADDPAARYSLPTLGDSAVIAATPTYTRQLTGRLAQLFDGSTGPLSPWGGWVDYASGYTASYAISLANRTVTLFGLLRRQAGPFTLDPNNPAEIATLPESLRPVRNEIGLTFTSGGLARWNMIADSQPLTLTLYPCPGVTAAHIDTNGFVVVQGISWRLA